jgi:hypothetical protein
MKNKETLKEAQEKHSPSRTIGNKYTEYTAQESFRLGAIWQADRMYSEEEILIILQEFKCHLSFGNEIDEINWFEQFKKK